MVKYICEICKKEFSQKKTHNTHIILKQCISDIKTQIINEEKNICEEGIDKFCTLPQCSKKCIDKVCELYDITQWDLIVEPSTGNCSFLNQIPSNDVIGIDILPEQKNIIKLNFFDYLPPLDKINIMVICNPPFDILIP